MASIIPFKGLIYDREKVGGDPSSVMAPPYDVISPKEQDALYAKNPDNIIRIILGKDEEGDGAENNKYTRAAGYLRKWQEEGILKRDTEDAFYVYLQDYTAEGRKFTRLGFFGLLKIEDDDDDPVVPHEHTLARPKEDRMNLIKETRANLSSIFTVFSDEGGRITSILKDAAASTEPLLDMMIDDVRHVLWRLADKNAVQEVQSLMKDKEVYIADGHHRYAVAKAYRDFRKAEEGYDGSADHVLMYFTDLEVSDNLTVFATHRVVKEMSLSGDSEIKNKLSGYFQVDEMDSLTHLMDKLHTNGESSHVFGYYGGDKYVALKLKDESSLTDIVKDDKSEEWKKLDVSILHSGIFRSLLSVKDGEGNLTYVHTAEEAERLVKDKSHSAAFFLNPTKVTEMTAVAGRGDMMPQKSTYFYPKLLTGLVINKFDKD